MAPSPHDVVSVEGTPNIRLVGLHRPLSAPGQWGPPVTSLFGDAGAARHVLIMHRRDRAGLGSYPADTPKDLDSKYLMIIPSTVHN